MLLLFCSFIALSLLVCYFVSIIFIVVFQFVFFFPINLILGSIRY